MGGAVNSVLKANPITNALGLSGTDTQGNYANTDGLQSYYGNYRKTRDQATDEVQNDALTKGVYGDGGLQSQLGTEGAQLANQGFSLTPQDNQAYGQAAGNVTRQFGQQEQQASQDLARRGLASAGSGAAGAAFSGLSGNKNEMLAKAQTDIATKRMQDTQNRLVQNRQLQAQLATQGNQMASDRWSQHGQSLQNAYNADQQGIQNQKAAVQPGLLSIAGQGLEKGISAGAQQAPGMALGGAGGSSFSPSGLFGGGSSSAPQGTLMSGQNTKNYGNYA